MQAADCPLRSVEELLGSRKNMLAQNNVVGVGVHIARHSEGTRVYGTQKFYAITGGSPTISRFHTTGDTASAYGFDGAALTPTTRTTCPGWPVLATRSVRTPGRTRLAPSRVSPCLST